MVGHNNQGVRIAAGRGYINGFYTVDAKENLMARFKFILAADVQDMAPPKH